MPNITVHKPPQSPSLSPSPPPPIYKKSDPKKKVRFTLFLLPLSLPLLLLLLLLLPMPTIPPHHPRRPQGHRRTNTVDTIAIAAEPNPSSAPAIVVDPGKDKRRSLSASP
jgi:hypothetical protein